MLCEINIVKRPESAIKTMPIVARIAKEVDAVVSPWGDAYITLPPHKILKKTMVLKQTNTPFVLFTSSIGPFGTGIKKWIAKKALSLLEIRNKPVIPLIIQIPLNHRTPEGFSVIFPINQNTVARSCSLPAIEVKNIITAEKKAFTTTPANKRLVT